MVQPKIGVNFASVNHNRTGGNSINSAHLDMKRKYYKTLSEAKQAHAVAVITNPCIRIFKMPKGTRKHGWYAVCSEIEYLNTY